MRENKSTSHPHYLSAARDLPLANAKANASSVGSVLAAASTATTACAYTPRLKSNRYSNNRIIAPTIDMIQPAT